jgi:phi13 family phage major tail protein
MADNKIRFGLKNVYYALLTDEATPTYSAPVAIPGAVTAPLDPDGDLAKFFADNVAYTTIASNNGYTGSLEMALVPDAVKAALLNWEEDDDGLVEIADAQPAPFALLFEVDGDDHNRRSVFYKCTVSRPKQDNKTKADKVEPATDTLSLMVMPINIDGRSVVQKAMEYSVAGAAVYDAWFSAVTLPSFSVS